jgi:hypothetical protein
MVNEPRKGKGSRGGALEDRRWLRCGGATTPGQVVMKAALHESMMMGDGGEHQPPKLSQQRGSERGRGGGGARTHD